MNGVIYCRVSSKEQVEGTSLESQEVACREYATRNHIDVLKVFIERGESAKFADRTQLLELLAFCGERNNAVRVLLVWKVDRLARNVGDHFSIKANLLKKDIQVVSVTEPIDANPEGKLLETILAGFAQFDNDVRAARTLQGMKRKMQEGLFPWKPPFGYKTVTQPGDKKTKADVPDQPVFGLLQRAWQTFAKGTYTKAELLTLMTAWGVRTRRGVPLSKQSLDNMLRDPFYAGIIRNPWTNEEHMGRHVPMVTPEMFGIVQGIMTRRSKQRKPHTHLRPELPLRMFARCSNCEHYVSGSLSRGRSQYYPYYRCFNAGCPMPGNYRTQVVHDEFVGFMESITPRPSNIERLRGALAQAAKSRTAVTGALYDRRKREQERLKEQREEIIQMKLEGLLTNEEFLTQKTRIMSRLHELGAEFQTDPFVDGETLSRLDEVSEPLTNLAATWLDIPISLKQRFQQSILPVGFTIGKIGTAQTSCLFTLCYDFRTPKSNLVHPEGHTWNRLARELQEFVDIFRMVRDMESA